MSHSVTAIVPIKPWGLAKSRLNVGQATRSRLARGFALDVLEAVVASQRVGRLVIVSAESEVHATARQLGAVVLQDRPLLSRDMLNVAIDSGRQWATVHTPDAPVIVVPADLAALTSSALDDSIDRLRHFDLAFVPDVSGCGTTVMWARTPNRLRTYYGPDSARRHLEDSGQAVIDVDPRVRQDVDDTTDLRAVGGLGVGRHTEAALSKPRTNRLFESRAISG